MNQPTIQIINTHSQNNRDHPQRSQNIRGSQNDNNQLQITLNIGVPLPRLQHTTDSFNGTFIATQYDLINGTNPFMGIQGVANPLPQSPPFSASLFSGDSFS
ncbi:hypothetical protein F8M41_020484 [Gigaspora margarita]|uniref:Uncharacterized protein n=1 Tax=Gigaspora margarita TaxID=4874 RepID=A0A8H4EJT3_GIGMA|nr:hypothetical protein F8M41_020484 [Gigaspora margarita]